MIFLISAIFVPLRSVHMRRYFVFVGLLVASCSINGANDNNAHSVQRKASPERRLAVILEVWTEAKYVVYPPGKILNLRVYDSGKAEFDYYPDQNEKKPFFTERRQFLLERTEITEIIRSIEDTSVNTWKDIYEPTVPILDAAIETTINLKLNSLEKRIVLKENHSNLILDKKTGVYPESLLNLLKFIQKINRQLLIDGRRSEVSNPDAK